MLLSVKRLLANRAKITFLAVCCSVLGFAAPVAADDSAVAVVDYTNRVIGGNSASSGQFPYMAALVRNNTAFLSNRQFCGASIISSKWLLTAAHCMYDQFGGVISADSFRVVAGLTNLRTEQPEELIVSNFYLHPNYDNNDIRARNDIALIELANEHEHAFVGLYSNDANALRGFNSTIIGWGATDYTDPQDPLFPNDLKYAVVPIVSKAVCNAPISYAGNISSTQVCAGFAAGGVDSCVGDSGGPLVTNIDGTTAQVGIVSFGNGCAEPAFYGVYTNVGDYISWINQYVRVSTVETPRALAGNGNSGVGGSAGESSGSGSGGGGGGMAWLLVPLLAGVRLQRR